MSTLYDPIHEHAGSGLRHAVSEPVLSRVPGKMGAPAQALGALALGAFALGAFAMGAVAIGALAIGRARIRRLEIDELIVGRLRVTDELQEPARAADAG